MLPGSYDSTSHPAYGGVAKFIIKDNMENNFWETIKELRIAVAAVDVAVFSIIENELNVFLIPINRPPHYINLSGVPGGLIKASETAEEAGERILKEKAVIKNLNLMQVYTFTNPDRDKRSRSISIAYLVLISPNSLNIKKSLGRWVPIGKLPALAYDHNQIVEVALDRLKAKLAYTNIASLLLPAKFSLTELQRIYEIILEKDFDKRNFRKRMLATGILEATGTQKEIYHRPATLYSFKNLEIITIPEIKSALA